jgi:hypothetical protein
MHKVVAARSSEQRGGLGRSLERRPKGRGGAVSDWAWCEQGLTAKGEAQLSTCGSISSGTESMTLER